MFAIYGDDIILENVKVGELKGGWPTLRDRAIDYLEGTCDGYVSEDEHCAKIEEASDKAYKQRYRCSRGKRFRRGSHFGN